MSSLVALLAHPDDEFAIFPWLRQAVREGRSVSCIWLTDGGWGGQSRQRRRLESVVVLERIGVSTSSMHFLGEVNGIEDGNLHRKLQCALKLVLSHVEHGAEVLVPAWEGGHPDHDATHLIGLELADRSSCWVRQYALYHGCGLIGPLFKVLSPLAENGPCQHATTTLWERLGYVAACLRYRSQWRSFVGLLPFYALRLMRRDAFALQPVSAARVMQKPHSGAMLYERRGMLTWEEFLDSIDYEKFQVFHKVKVV